MDKPKELTRELAEKIYSYLKAGKSLSKISKLPDMPTKRTFDKWMNDGFKESLRVFQINVRKYEQKKASSKVPLDDYRNFGFECIYTPQIAHEIIDGLNSGVSLRTICKGKGMPSYATVMRWSTSKSFKYYEDFAPEFKRAIQGYRNSKIFETIDDCEELASQGYDKEEAEISARTKSYSIRLKALEQLKAEESEDENHREQEEDNKQISEYVNSQELIEMMIKINDSK